MARICRCLSEDEHSGDDIVDPVVHYFGCLLMCERKAYFESLAKIEQDKIKTELRRVKRLRHFVQQKGRTRQPDENGNNHSQSDGLEGRRLVANLKDSLEEWKKTLTNDNKTWNAVRKHRLGRRRDCCHPQPQSNAQEAHDGTNGNAKPNIPNRASPEIANENWTPISSEQYDGGSYDPSKDIKAYFTQYKKPVSPGTKSKTRSHEEDEHGE